MARRLLVSGEHLAESVYSSTVVHGRGVYNPIYHPKTHGIPVALLHFRGYVPTQLELYTHFAAHAAAALGVPISHTVMLPRKRSLWTVPRGPFAHKKTQENFERVVHKRAIKAWDAHPVVIDRWLAYLRLHAVGGVGLRVVRWERVPISIGKQRWKNAQAGLDKVSDWVTVRDKVEEMGASIVEQELKAADEAAVESDETTLKES